MTLGKLAVVVGDHAAAMAYAKYPLEEADAPRHFARDPDSDDARRANAIWVGSETALGKLGLERGREANAEQLRLALEGRHTVTGDRVRRYGTRTVIDDDGNVVRDEAGEEVTELVVNNYDVTLGLPKDLGLLWAAADAMLRRDLEHGAVTSAVEAVDHLSRTRPVIGGKRIPGHGFAGMAAVQVTARAARGEVAPSPHLHVHLDMVGVLDGDVLKTPASEALYKHSAMREIGAFARVRMARRVVGMGFGVKTGTGIGGRYFAVAGVPSELVEEMSGRSRDVEAWRAAREAEGGAKLTNREAARGALATRASKTKLPGAETQAFWEEQMGDFAVEAIRRSAPATEAAPGAEAGDDPTVEELREYVRDRILEKIWAEGPTVSLGVVRSISLELLPLGLDVEDAYSVLDDMHAAGELVPLAGWRVTSGEIRSKELFVQDVAARAAARGDRGLSERAVAAGIASAESILDPGSKLYEDQQEAVRRLTSGAGWSVLTGRAGTGKGPVLRAVADAYREEGWKVVPLALDGANAELLGHQVGSQALTVAQLLYRLSEGLRVSDDVRTVDARTLLLIDEASKIGLRQWQELAQIVDAVKARGLAVGDVGQIGAIESPGMLDVMISDEQIPTAELTTVRRHRDPLDPSQDHPWAGKKYLDLLYEGDAAGAIATLRRENAITMLDTREEAMQAMVDRWAERRRDHQLDVKDTVLVVYGSNDDVDRVNVLAQWRRVEAGEIGGRGVAAVDRDYRIHAGDVVMMREAAYKTVDSEGNPGRRVENGTRGVVERVDGDAGQVWVRFAQPDKTTRVVQVDLAGLRDAKERGVKSVPSLRLAYAGHPFPLQGATFAYVASLWGHWSQRKEETYSGDARMKLWLDVFVDRVSAGTRGTDEARYKRLARKLSVPWHRLASITYKETPKVRVGADVHLEDVRYEMPLREPEVAAEELAAAVDAAPGDPLRGFDRILAPDVVERIRAAARALEPRVGELDSETLEQAVAAASKARAELDGEIAYEVARNDQDRAILAKRVAEAYEQADRLEEEAAELGLLDRGERADLFERMQAEDEAAAVDAAMLEDLELRDRAIRKSGKHPDDWLRAHAQTIARGVAAQAELARRGERERVPAADSGPATARDPAAGFDLAG